MGPPRVIGSKGQAPLHDSALPEGEWSGEAAAVAIRRDRLKLAQGQNLLNGSS
jgi:hypothetical protein